MKRLILCALAVLLTSGALIGSRPAHACTIDPTCASEGCEWKCGTRPYNCNMCTGLCTCL